MIYKPEKAATNNVKKIFLSWRRVGPVMGDRAWKSGGPVSERVLLPFVLLDRSLTDIAL